MILGLILPLFIAYTGIYLRMHNPSALIPMMTVLALGLQGIRSTAVIGAIFSAEMGNFPLFPDFFSMMAVIILLGIGLEQSRDHFRTLQIE